MKIHVLGVSGTFMGGIARIARELGHEVSGSDAGAYPPMSEQLAAADIGVHEGYDDAFLAAEPDIVLVGNALSRGNPAVEALLDSGVAYTSGPQWLFDNVLHDRWVIAVAGTHGKTTVTSLVAWLLHAAGLEPGFLVGGVPANFGVSARLGEAPFFVVEADEYDTALFDKRPKFMHYRPRTLVVNNIEFDHADIYDDLSAIRVQFGYLLRTLPSSGLLVHNATDPNIAEVRRKGCWSRQEGFAVAAAAAEATDTWVGSGSGTRIQLRAPGGRIFVASTPLAGQHNLGNALAAVAAARHAGVPIADSLAALREFAGVARRLQVIASARGITVYDDFAHHPTAIRATLQAVRELADGGRVVAVLELASNSMRAGVHAPELAASLAEADLVHVLGKPDLKFDLGEALKGLKAPARIAESVDSIAKSLIPALHNGDHVVLMSNSSFGGLHDKFVAGID